MLLTLPPKTKNLLENYLRMRFGQLTISCPYFQNITGRKSRPVFVGKGSPKEIQSETLRLFRKNGKKLSYYDPQSLRYNMVMAGIGIDCSGLTVRIIDSFLREKGLGGIRKNIKPQNLSLLSWLRHYLRTYTNISADSLSGDTNCFKIGNMNDVRPGDFLRESYMHVAVITDVEIKGGNVTKIIYCHSTWDYQEKYGVKKGSISILDPVKPLEKQRWEEYLRGRNWMYEDFLKCDQNDRGIRRLKVLQNL